MKIDCIEEFESIVGLSDFDPTCFPGDAPDGFDKSLSGYYLTDYENGVPLLTQVEAARTVDDTSIWAILQKARNQAIQDFETTFLAAMYDGKTSHFQVYSGKIGKDTPNGLVLSNRTKAGLAIEGKNFKGSYIKIKKIGIALDTTVASIPVNIVSFDGDDYSIKENLTVSSVAGQMNYNDLETPIELPLWTEDYQQQDYYLVFDIPEGSNYLKTKLNCCGKKPAWMDYANIRGLESDNLLEDGYNFFSDSRGISIDAYLQCKSFDWLCNIEELQGYDLIKSIAKSIQFKASAKVISKILDSGNINYYTLLGEKPLHGRRNHYNKRFNEIVMWIAENLPSHMTDCFKCKQNNFKRAALLV